ncbi:hypothetical protein LOK74_01975 [Brevibacillus humidisoli]|uniref:hypothetical protein n=1 Tax=Brevibacillus humidisoli TaxID=2895522 RepID=UPI001E31C6AF|nr:hypothetical protein [Brevibacillus humidisoli]UFJ41328.1 hypothetical protein LOK74_01975 [Brevibacillus humidisoli]
MPGIAKFIAFFLFLTVFVAYFVDIAVISFSKEDLRSSAVSAAKNAVIRHMDWAALRVGQPPYLLTEGIDETIENVIETSTNFRGVELEVEYHARSTPAVLSLIVEGSYPSSFLELSDYDQGERALIPVRVTEIIESKYTTENN